MISKRNRQILLFFLRDERKKNWFRIIREFTVLYLSTKKLPINYISHLLYRKDVTNFKAYLNLEENKRLLQWSHSMAEEEISIVENKFLFEKFLTSNNISTPRLFFHNSKHDFTYNNESFKLRTKNDLCYFLTKIFNEKSIDQLFCKPVDGIRGDNIFIITKTTLQELDDALVGLIFSKAFIFQEVIVQHEILKKVNHSSINTLRVVTYKNEKKEVEILSGFIRFGRKGAIIDNAHIGGIVVPINKENGKMRAPGIQLIDNGGGIFDKHPDTEVVFENFQIPLYEEVKKIVTKAALCFELPLLGWDVAITPSVATIIEANHDFHLLLSDLTEKGLKKSPTIKKLLERIP